MSRKSLDRILKEGVDEPEQSLDTVEAGAAETVTDEAEDTPDKDEPEPAPKAKAKAEVKDEPEPEDEPKGGLPPWAHARVKSATEAKSAAEKRAEDAERRAAELEAWYQQQTGQAQEPTVADYLSEMERKMTESQQTLKVVTSKKFAEREYGAEEVERALAWAKDRCDSDPQFNQQMWVSPDPASDAVREFRKAQTFSELDRYGGDINKLIEAKLAERGAIQTDVPASPQQTQKRMPGNFSTGSGAQSGRSAPTYSGPTPLGDLLK